MSRVSIGDDTVVGAGAVVTRDLPAGVVAAGVPARVLREIGPGDREAVPATPDPPPGRRPAPSPGNAIRLQSMTPDPINRRQALGALGGVSLAGLLAACGAGGESPKTVQTTTGETATVEPKASAGSPSRTGLTAERFDSAATCEVATELTEGPYYFDVDAIRSDIREDREGTLLRLGVRVRDAGSCEPIENAVVDVWHCDALGLYSGFEAASNGAGGSGRTDEETYLRGAQATDAGGIVEFKTIYPGWYRGRTTHIHAKVHLDKRTLLTTQLYTTKAMDDAVHAGRPYSEDPGRDTFNESDVLYAEAGELTLSRDGEAVLGLITLDVRRA